MDNEVSPGRLPIQFLDIRILALLDDQSFHSLGSIADALGVFHSTILNHLQELLGMKSFHFGWIPNKL
jgi:transcriptional antiterminator